MFDFENFPIKLSGETVDYVCPKCKYKFQAPIEAAIINRSEDFIISTKKKIKTFKQSIKLFNSKTIVLSFSFFSIRLCPPPPLRDLIRRAG